jgi:hypothetical protein
MSDEHQKDAFRKPASEAEDGGKKPYEPPVLTRFGPMRDLTKLDPGPVEDFVAYGGPS